MRKGNRRKASPEHRLKMMTKAMRRDQEHLRRQSELDRMAQGHRWDPAADWPRPEHRAEAATITGADVLVIDDAGPCGSDIVATMRDQVREIEDNPWGRIRPYTAGC